MGRDDFDGRRVGVEYTVEPLRFLRRIADETVTHLPHEIRIAGAPHATPGPEIRAGDGVAFGRAPRQQAIDAAVEHVAIHRAGGSVVRAVVTVDAELLEHDGL